MKPKSILVAVLLVGLVAGIVWQQSAINKLKAENEQLREKNKQADELLAENERLSREKIDPAELQRLRDSQSELLRLRGQALQLKREAQEARAAARAAERVAQQPVSDEADVSDLPVQTFVANVNASVGWNQSLVTGGWKTPSGKRALFFMEPVQESDANTVTVRTRIVEMPENVFSAMGFDSLRTDNGLNARANTYSAEQTENLLKSLEGTEGVSVITAPTVTTLSGRQAQVQTIATHQTPSGQSYTTGPSVDIIPHISADGQTVHMVVIAQVNYAQGQSSQ